MFKRFDARAGMIVAALWVSCALGLAARAEDVPNPAMVSALDRGFSGLYNLDFAEAQRDFAAWQQMHPDDPVGPVSEAAGFLFSEFNRLGVLESQFYENDESFLRRSKLTADPVLRDHFQAAIGRAENLSHARLAKDPKDQDALFALTLSSGLQADYAALIEKRAIWHRCVSPSKRRHRRSNCLQSVMIVTTRCWRPASANTSSAAWQPRCGGCFGWEDCHRISRAALRTCKRLPNTDTTWRRSREFFCRLRMCGRRIRRGRCNC